MKTETLLALKDIIRAVQKHAVGRFPRLTYTYTCRFCGAHSDSRNGFLHANTCESVVATEILPEIDELLKGK